ncbi:unnamed protein product [Prorocentrum cordatum]|uniref:Uncharacterized protein n=1 Tax=Prorocentrum cordatum TaxID=2364126 RepID=A0ABN9RD10_9DINO|nr:unnamed protein product [Polarella glacialis]
MPTASVWKPPSASGQRGNETVSLCPSKSRDAEDTPVSPARSGLVICSLQRTALDGHAALRIFAKLDRLAAAMVDELDAKGSHEPPTMRDLVAASAPRTVKVEVPDIDPLTGNEVMVEVEQIVYPPRLQVEKGEGRERGMASAQPEEDLFLVPYEAATGRRIKEAAGSSEKGEPISGQLTQLDLREGATVKLVIGPHAGDDGEVVGKQKEGHYRIRFRHALKPGAKLKAPFERILGTWWVEAAVKGEVEVLPVVNV